MGDATGTGESRKRARRTSFAPPVTLAGAAVASPKADRPTAAEAAAAAACIAAVKAADNAGLQPALLGAKADEPKPAVVACALALYFGQVFESDRKAKLAFGVGKSTDVQERWVEDKLPRLFKFTPEAAAAAELCFKPATTPTASVAASDAPANLLPSMPPALPAEADTPTDQRDLWWTRGFQAGQDQRNEIFEKVKHAMNELREEQEISMERYREEAEKMKALLALESDVLNQSEQLHKENDELRRVIDMLQAHIAQECLEMNGMLDAATERGWDGLDIDEEPMPRCDDALARKTVPQRIL